MQDKSLLRSQLFQHLDGLVTAPVAYALWEKGVLDFLVSEKSVSLKNLSAKFKSNEGYLNVAMRVLASQGFIDFKVDNAFDEITYAINSKSKIAFDLFPLYKDVVELSKFAGNFHNRVFQEEPFLRLKPLFEKSFEKRYKYSIFI